MQGNTGQQNGGSQNQNNPSQKPSGLSWSQPLSGSQSAPKSVTPPLAPVTRPVVTPPIATLGKPSTGKTSGTSKRFIGILAGGMLLGFILGWAWFMIQSGTSPIA